MLVAGEPFGHLRDLLLLGFDEGMKMLDRSPQRPQGAARFEGSQNRCGACELSTKWWTVVA
jgi:hypothetical protein